MMALRKTYLVAAAMLTLVAMTPVSSQAGLIGAGRTVQAQYYNGVLAGPELEINTVTNDASPAPLTSPVSYIEGAIDGSTILVADTQITITNLLDLVPFCTANVSGTACPDAIDGFGFVFTGEDILGVSVDAASSSDFLPVSGAFQGNTHLGLQLISNNEIRVDVTGDLPKLNDQLILDLSFAAPPNPTPEPGSLALLGAGFAGLAGVRLRQRRSRQLAN